MTQPKRERKERLVERLKDVLAHPEFLAFVAGRKGYSPEVWRGRVTVRLAEASKGL